MIDAAEQCKLCGCSPQRCFLIYAADVQEVESRATCALEKGVEVEPSVSAASTSTGAAPRPDGGVEMRPLPDMPASAPFWYQVLSRARTETRMAGNKPSSSITSVSSDDDSKLLTFSQLS